MFFVNLSQAPFIILLFMIGLGIIIGTIMRRKKIINLFFSKQQQQLFHNNQIKGVRIFKTICLIIALLMLCLALLDPRGTSLTSDIKLEGSDIVLTFDLSRSMDAEDEKPSRLDFAKSLSDQLLNSLVGNRIGLVAFAAEAGKLLPLTTDISTVSLFIRDLDTGMFSSQSTDIGKALMESIKLFSEDTLTHKTIIVFTDGENLDGDLDEPLDNIKKQGINLFFIGMGTQEGGNIPLYNEKRENIGYLMNKNKQVLTKLDADYLKKLADKANGKYFKGSRLSINDIISDIDKLEQNPFGASTQNFLEPKFRSFILIALIALLLYLFIPEQKIKKIMLLIIFTGIVQPAFSLGAEQNGYRNYKKQEYSKALRCYQRSLIKNPTKEKVKFGEGATLYKLERGDRSVNTFLSLTNSKNDKLRAKALFNAGNAKALAKNNKDAFDIYKKIMKEYPADSKIYKKALNNYLYLKAQEAQQQQQQQQQNDNQNDQEKKNNNQQNNSTNSQNNTDDQNDNRNDEKSKNQQNKNNENQSKNQNMKDETPSQSISANDIDNLLGVAEEEEQKTLQRQNSKQKKGVFDKNKW